MAANNKPTAAPSSPESWVELHGDALYRFAFLRVRDRANAEDLVQETLMAALASRQNFSAQSAERTWLVAILRHKLIDFWRLANRAAADDSAPGADDPDQLLARTFDAAAADHWRSAPCAWRDPDAALEQEDFWQVMTRCVQGLPDRQAQAFCLCEVDGVENAQACKVLEVSPTNLWVMLHRARIRLRQCLERHWFEN